MLDTIWESLYALKSGKVNDTVSETVNEIVNDTERALISVISKNPSVTILQMIAVTGFLRSLASLKEKGVVVRVGSDKKGYWEVIFERGLFRGRIILFFQSLFYSAFIHFLIMPSTSFTSYEISLHQLPYSSHSFTA